MLHGVQLVDSFRADAETLSKRYDELTRTVSMLQSELYEARQQLEALRISDGVAEGTPHQTPARMANSQPTSVANLEQQFDKYAHKKKPCELFALEPGSHLLSYEAGMERLQAELERQTVALDSAALSPEIEDDAEALPALLSPSVTVWFESMRASSRSAWPV